MRRATSFLSARHAEAGLWAATAFAVGVGPGIAWPHWTADVPRAAVYC